MPTTVRSTSNISTGTSTEKTPELKLLSDISTDPKRVLNKRRLAAKLLIQALRDLANGTPNQRIKAALWLKSPGMLASICRVLELDADDILEAITDMALRPEAQRAYIARDISLVVEKKLAGQINDMN